MEKSKMNVLSIHTIYDIQINVHHHGIPKVHILGFGQLYDIALQALPRKPPSSFKDRRKSKNTYISRYGERRVDKTEFFHRNVKILCCIADLIPFVTNESEKLMKGSVSARVRFIHRQRCFGVNISKGKQSTV